MGFPSFLPFPPPFFPASPPPLLFHSPNSNLNPLICVTELGRQLSVLSRRGLPRVPPRGIAYGPVPFCPSGVRICTNEPLAPAWGPRALRSGVSSSSPVRSPLEISCCLAQMTKIKDITGKGAVPAGPAVLSETLHPPAHQLLRAGLIRGACSPRGNLLKWKKLIFSPFSVLRNSSFRLWRSLTTTPFRSLGRCLLWKYAINIAAIIIANY